jgi:hypothetical protein
MERDYFMKRIIVFGAAIFCAVLVVGCQGTSRPKDLPPLYPCEIIVTQDGKPLDDAVVDLVPTETANTKYRASSVTDTNGKAFMATYGFRGVPAGRYKVCIWKTVTEGVTKYTDKDGELQNTNGTEYRTVDSKYANAESTPHEIEITDKQNKSNISFDVGKPVKIAVQ